MLDYKTLLHADFTELSQAVGKWAKLPTKFTKAGTQFNTTVLKSLADSDWEGETRDAALDKMNLVYKQLTAASEEATDVHKLLDDAYEVFTSCQSQLRRLKGDLDKDKYLSIKADGEVWFDPPADTPTDQLAALRKGYQESIEAYRTSIGNQVDAAADADDILHWALSQDHNGRGKGFDPNTYSSLKDATKGRAQADKELKELTELASRTDELSIAQLKRVNALLSKHEGDPYFSEKFALALGPKGVLQFYTRVADRVQYGDDRTKTSASLQKSLSFTLATASNSGSHAMDTWQKEMIGLGDERVSLLDMRRGIMVEGPYGYQVMSSLMRSGTYDKDFLGDYGKSLIAFEKAHAKTDPKELWAPDGYETYLNFGTGDHGKDPMAGYLEALGHNPEAAQNLFVAKDWGPGNHKLDPDLQYLLKDRAWPNGNTLAGDNSGYGYEELGHALEAATLGVPFDQPELGLNRDERSANVMTQVVMTVAADQGFVDDRDGIGGSLAEMGAGYIDDLDWATATFGDGRDGQATRDAAFNHTGPGHIDLQEITAAGFLSAVGRHEGGYEILSLAQQEYTVSALKAHPHPDDELTAIIETGGQTHGILDQSRTDQINADYGDKTDKANEKMAEAGEWKKFGVSQGIGVAVGLATLPFGGPAVGAAVAFAVPAVIEGVGGAIEAGVGNEIDQQLKEKEADFDRQEEKEKGTLVQLGRARASDPLEAYVAVHPEVAHTDWYRQLALEAAYNGGVSLADQLDAD